MKYSNNMVVVSTAGILVLFVALTSAATLKSEESSDRRRTPVVVLRGNRARSLQSSQTKSISDEADDSKSHLKSGSLLRSGKKVYRLRYVPKALLEGKNLTDLKKTSESVQLELILPNSAGFQGPSGPQEFNNENLYGPNHENFGSPNFFKNDDSFGPNLPDIGGFLPNHQDGFGNFHNNFEKFNGNGNFEVSNQKQFQFEQSSEFGPNNPDGKSNTFFTSSERNVRDGVPDNKFFSFKQEGNSEPEVQRFRSINGQEVHNEFNHGENQNFGGFNENHNERGVGNRPTFERQQNNFQHFDGPNNFQNNGDQHNNFDGSQNFGNDNQHGPNQFNEGRPHQSEFDTNNNHRHEQNQFESNHGNEDHFQQNQFESNSPQQSNRENEDHFQQNHHQNVNHKQENQFESNSPQQSNHGNEDHFQQNHHQNVNHRQEHQFESNSPQQSNHGNEGHVQQNHPQNVNHRQENQFDQGPPESFNHRHEVNKFEPKLPQIINHGQNDNNFESVSSHNSHNNHDNQFGPGQFGPSQEHQFVPSQNFNHREENNNFVSGPPIQQNIHQTEEHFNDNHGPSGNHLNNNRDNQNFEFEPKQVMQHENSQNPHQALNTNFNDGSINVHHDGHNNKGPVNFIPNVEHGNNDHTIPVHREEHHEVVGPLLDLHSAQPVQHPIPVFVHEVEVQEVEHHNVDHPVIPVEQPIPVQNVELRQPIPVQNVELRQPQQFEEHFQTRNNQHALEFIEVSQTPVVYQTQEPRNQFISIENAQRIASQPVTYENSDFSTIPGQAGVDFQILTEIPATSFSCAQQAYPGYYADQEAGCQVFHVCGINIRNKQSFMCPVGTVFDQSTFVCNWWYNVDCNLASQYYALNQLLYVEDDSSQYALAQPVEQVQTTALVKK